MLPQESWGKTPNVYGGVTRPSRFFFWEVARARLGLNLGDDTCYSIAYLKIVETQAYAFKASLNYFLYFKQFLFYLFSLQSFISSISSVSPSPVLLVTPLYKFGEAGMQSN